MGETDCDRDARRMGAKVETLDNEIDSARKHKELVAQLTDGSSRSWIPASASCDFEQR